MKLILIGIISGIVTGLGMGGGSILILFLTLFMMVNQHTAQAANLIFFIPTSISAIYVYFKNKNVDAQIGKKLLYTVIIGAIGGAYLTKFIDSSNLKKYFGMFILAVGVIDIILTIKKKVKDNKKEGVK